MPEEVGEQGADTGLGSAGEVDVAALFDALRQEVRRSGVDPGGTGGVSDWPAARAEAERLWPVSADRSLRLRPGSRGAIGIPVKWVLRKLMRWYVEPVAYDQRSFNASVLRLLDELKASQGAAAAGQDTGRASPSPTPSPETAASPDGGESR